MEFVNVTAQPCNSQGITSQQQRRAEVKISEDLIAAYSGDTIYLKGGDVLNLGGKYFCDLKVHRKPTKLL